MRRPAIAFTFVVILALGAGVVAGFTWHRLPAASVPDRPARTTLAEQLQLSDAQAQDMRKIWEGVRDKVDGVFVDAQALQKDRDTALFAMLNDDQKIKFAGVQKDYAARLAALKTQRDAIFDQAVKQTEQILSDAQKKRYREIIASRLDRKSSDEPDWLPKPPATGQQE